MSQFGFYPGDKFFGLKLTKRRFLVDKIIKEKDSVIMVGDAKSGKSLLMFQLICSLTSQHPFLDKFTVNRPCKVTYLQLEGELEDSQDRFLRLTKTLDFDRELFQLGFLQPLELEWERTRRDIIEKIKLFHVPDVLIVDPLYFALSGDLNDNKPVRRFIGQLRILKEELGCAIVIIHHTKKMQLNKYGELTDMGDDALFGSAFFRAWPDHLLLFVYNKQSNIRTLYCKTQRSQDIKEETNLRLIQPMPLYFEEVEEISENIFPVIELLMKEENKGGLTAEDIIQLSGLSRPTFYRSIKKALVGGNVVKTDSRPVLYQYKPNLVSHPKVVKNETL